MNSLPIEVICSKCGETFLVINPIAIRHYHNGIELVCTKCSSFSADSQLPSNSQAKAKPPYSEDEGSFNEEPPAFSFDLSSPRKDSDIDYLDDEGGVDLTTVRTTDLHWVQYILDSLVKEEKISFREYKNLVVCL